MVEKDVALTAAVKLARRMPMFFVFIVKSMTHGKLLISKRKLTGGAVMAARKAAGGGKIFRGRCMGEEGKLVFELPKEPPRTLGKQLRNLIARETGLFLRVVARVAADLVADQDEQEAEDDHDATVPADTRATGAAAARTPPGPAAAGSPPLRDAVRKRLAALVDSFKEVIAKHGPEGARLRELYTSLRDFLGAQDYEQAAKVLDEMERQI
jgi:hypothetical protein